MDSNSSLTLSVACLKAVQAHSEGATPNEVLNYLSSEFGMTVRPNHLGAALQRHRLAGRLENRRRSSLGLGPAGSNDQARV
jgi:hypothetical protein